jgi:hypothetical protein
MRALINIVKRRPTNGIKDLMGARQNTLPANPEYSTGDLTVREYPSRIFIGKTPHGANFSETKG